jgi:hypothetical protein
MKTFMSYAIVALLLVGFASSFSTAATFEKTVVNKTTTTFDYFRAHRQAFGVALNWSASDAVSFKVERSYDGEFFEDVTTIEAGGVAEHKFIDEDIYPGTIYYRVGAVDANGSVDYSEVKKVLFVSNK